MFLQSILILERNLKLYDIKENKHYFYKNFIFKEISFR
jgi:hypothetical protein